MDEISDNAIEDNEKNSDENDVKSKLLDNQRIETIDYKNCDNNEYCVVVDAMSASWDPKTVSPTLRNISVQLKRGELLAVIGPVGAGKVCLTPNAFSYDI